MKKIKINPSGYFNVIETTKRSQLAEMVLTPGQSTGGPNNKHPNSDQWLYIVSGIGKAIVNGENVDLKTGEMLLLEAGETHEITNTGNKDLKTFSVYAPAEF